MKRYGRHSGSDAAAVGLAVTAVGVLGLLFLVLVFGLSIGVFALLVWAGNYGLHVAFGLAMLGFKKTVGLAVVVQVAKMVLYPTPQVKS